MLSPRIEHHDIVGPYYVGDGSPLLTLLGSGDPPSEGNGFAYSRSPSFPCFVPWVSESVQISTFPQLISLCTHPARNKRSCAVDKLVSMPGPYDAYCLTRETPFEASEYVPE